MRFKTGAYDAAVFWGLYNSCLQENREAPGNRSNASGCSPGDVEGAELGGHGGNLRAWTEWTNVSSTRRRISLGGGGIRSGGEQHLDRPGQKLRSQQKGKAYSPSIIRSHKTKGVRDGETIHTSRRRVGRIQDVGTFNRWGAEALSDQKESPEGVKHKRESWSRALRPEYELGLPRGSLGSVKLPKGGAREEKKPKNLKGCHTP